MSDFDVVESKVRVALLDHGDFGPEGPDEAAITRIATYLYDNGYEVDTFADVYIMRYAATKVCGRTLRAELGLTALDAMYDMLTGTAPCTPELEGW